MLVSGESSLPGLQTSAFSLCPHVAFPSREGGQMGGGRDTLMSLPFLIKALILPD